MRKRLLLISLIVAIALLPVWLRMFLILFNYNGKNRSFTAKLDNLCCFVQIIEIEHDKMLSFSIYKNDGEQICSDLFIKNNHGHVASFVLVKGIDSIFIVESSNQFEEYLTGKEGDFINIDNEHEMVVPTTKSLHCRCRFIQNSGPRFFNLNDKLIAAGPMYHPYHFEMYRVYHNKMYHLYHFEMYHPPLLTSAS